MITLVRAFSAGSGLEYIRHDISAHQSLKAKRPRFYELFIVKPKTGSVERACHRKDGIPLASATCVLPEVHCCSLCGQRLRDRMICRDQGGCAEACQNPPLCRLFIDVERAAPDVFLIQKNIGRELFNEITRIGLRANVEIRITAIRLLRRWSLRRARGSLIAFGD